MYQVYIDTPTSFEPEMVGEFKDFDKALELGSTKAMFCGHDHFNHFSINYKI